MDIHPTDCPGWEYKLVPDHDSLLKARAIVVLRQLRNANKPERSKGAADTRQIHGPYFEGLTPPKCEYYAGYYRGEEYRCLRRYEVHIPGDPIVGHQPATVPLEMIEFARQIERVVKELDYLWSVNRQVVSEAEIIYRTIELAAALLVYFLEIHPYADGNGHMGRFLLVAVLGRYDIFPKRFPLHPRPDPPYAQLLPLYRQGNPRALEHYLLKCI